MIKNYEDGSVTHTGAVLVASTHYRHVHSDNAMIDSGEVLTVVVREDGQYKTLVFDMGRSDRRVYAEVDAPADVLAQYAADLAQVAALDAEVREVEAAERAARTVTKGKRIVVIRGRKVARGTAGVCIWIGDGTYGTRVGLKDDAGTVHWTSLDNVKVA